MFYLFEFYLFYKKKLFTIIYQSIIQYQNMFMVEERDRENSYLKMHASVSPKNLCRLMNNEMEIKEREEHGTLS